MEIAKRTIEDLITAADEIIEANSTKEVDLFGEVPLKENVREILGISEQNPDYSYSLYYNNIQSFLRKILPEDDNIREVIRNLVATLLSHKEKDNISYGKRGGDSRMAKTEDMENLINILSEWSDTPTDFWGLAMKLLNKCKELKYIPEDRTLMDYTKGL